MQRVPPELQTDPRSTWKTALGMMKPRDLVPAPSLGGPPAAGRQRVFVGGQWECHRKFPGLRVVACHCRGTVDQGLCAPQSTCPRVLVEAGITPTEHLHGPAPLATPPHDP